MYINFEPLNRVSEVWRNSIRKFRRAIEKRPRWVERRTKRRARLDRRWRKNLHVVICCKSIKREILNIEILSTISKPEFNRFKVECDVEVTCHSEVVEKNAHFKNYSALCHLKEKGEWISAPLFDFGKDNKFYLKLEKIQI